MKLFSAAACAFLLWILQDVLFHRFWARGLCVSLDFNCRGVTEGERGILRETITNAKALPLPVLHVKFHMGKHLVFTASGNSRITDHNYRSDIFSCMPWQKIRRTLEFDCRRRGYYTIDQVQLVSYDLFFSSRYVASLPARAAFYVYPGAADPGRLTLPFRSLTGQILAQKALIPDPFETRSVRPYETCDPYRSVNWKATARTGELKVNVYAPTSSRQVMLLLDVDSDRIWKDQDLTEEAIRLCGSYCGLLTGEGIPVSVSTNGIDCITGSRGYLEAGAGRGHWQSVMELLARISSDDNDRLPMEEIIEEMFSSSQSSAAGDGSGLVYVLISPKQRPSLALAYNGLCRLSPGSQWILPLRPGQDFPSEGFCPLQYHHMSVFPWEVPYDYSQTS